MKFIFSIGALSAVAAGLMPLSATAQTSAVTDPVGYYSLALPGNSDTFVSIPFSRPPEYVGSVSSISAGTINFTSAAFAISPKQFVYVAGTQAKTYYAFVSGGTKEGNFYTVTDNSANGVTVDLAGDDISATGAVTSVKIIPYWTLGTAFPSGQGINPTTGFVRATEIYLPNTAAAGTSALPSSSFYYSQSAAKWLQSSGTSVAVPSDVILYPDNYFIVRQNVATATTFTPVGGVITNKLSIPLATSPAGRQDNYVALARPVPVTLTDSGLISSGAFTPSTGFTTKDTLFVYDNTVIQKNKLPSASYVYTGGVWRMVNDPIVGRDAGGDVVFAPGTGVVIRKSVNTGGTTAFWANSPTY